jgi:hypothetical protein
MTTNLVDCPECGLPATARSEGRVWSTGGAVEHLHLHCVLGHRFFGPAELLLRPLRAA